MIFLKICGCAALNESRKNTLIYSHIGQAEKLSAEGFCWQAVSEYEKALQLCQDQPPADKVLYQKGLLLIGPCNPEPEFDRALAAFREMIDAYPESRYMTAAKTWVYVIEAHIALGKRLAESELKVNALDRHLRDREKKVQSLKEELKTLKEQLKKLKQIDLELNKKRELSLPAEE